LIARLKPDSTSILIVNQQSEINNQKFWTSYHSGGDGRLGRPSKAKPSAPCPELVT
jgi:hypothetical protein